jgi:hypothetical protein
MSDNNPTSQRPNIKQRTTNNEGIHDSKSSGMIRHSVRAAAIALFLVCTGSLLAAGCSSTKTADTTLAATTTDSITTEALADLEGLGDTPPIADESAPLGDSEIPESSGALGEPEPTELPTEAPSDTPLSEDTAAAVVAGPAELTDQQLKSAFTAMGIVATPDKLTCVKGKAGKSIDMSSEEPPPEFLRALMFCVPALLVDANTEKITESAAKSGATKEDAQCFQAKTFETMAALDLATFTKLLEANAPIDFPADIKAKIRENTKECALTDAQFASLLEG